MREIPPSQKRTCRQCHGWVNSVSPQTFKLVEGWVRWRHRNTVAFLTDLDAYLCAECFDGYGKSEGRQPQLFDVGCDGALTPPATASCQHCDTAVWPTRDDCYLLLRGWVRSAKLVTNTRGSSVHQNNSLTHVVVMGVYLCRECFKRKKARIHPGQLSMFGE